MPENLLEIKSMLDSRLGEEIVVTVQMGRKKKRERRGTLAETYRSIFIVDLNDEDSIDRVSYSYKDVLTNAVEIEF